MKAANTKLLSKCKITKARKSKNS